MQLCFHGTTAIRCLKICQKMTGWPFNSFTVTFTLKTLTFLILKPHLTIPDSGRKQWDDNPHRKTSTTTTSTTTTTTTTTTRRPSHEPDRRHYPHRTDSPVYRPPKHHPHNKPYNPKHHYGHRVFTEKPDTDATKRPYKPYYPRYPSNNPETTDYPRYYPDRPRPYTSTTTTTTTQRPYRRQPPTDKPETCNTSYDAITIIRGELFIFKDRVS